MKESTKKVLDIRANAVKYSQRIIRKCRSSENPAETFRSMRIGFEESARRAAIIAETRRAREIAAEIAGITSNQIGCARSYLDRIGIEVEEL